MIRTVSLALVAGLMGLGAAPPASAHQTFVVDSTGDADDDSPGDGVCKGTYVPAPGEGEIGCFLRAAIEEANALDGADEIVVPDGTYLLEIAGTGENAAATGDLDVTEDLTIRAQNDAGAPGGVVVDADGLDRVLEVRGSAEVVIEGITLRGGDAPSGAGGVRNDHVLTLRRCAVRGNTGTTAGGIDNLPGSELVLEDCSVAENHASAGTGGIRSDRADLLLRRSTLRGNTASGPGALLNVSNAAGAGTAVLVNSTVSGNGDPAIRYEGTEAVTELYNVTVAGNDGVGLSGPGTANAARLENSALAQNQGTDCTGPVVSAGHNLVETTGGSCSPGDPTDLAGTAMLFPLGDNGGPTRTHRPRPGSPLVDGGTPPGGGGCTAMDLQGALAALAVDQRGASRPVDGDDDSTAVCDVGAVELPEPAAGLAAGAALGLLAALRRLR